MRVKTKPHLSWRREGAERWCLTRSSLGRAPTRRNPTVDMHDMICASGASLQVLQGLVRWVHCRATAASAHANVCLPARVIRHEGVDAIPTAMIATYGLHLNLLCAIHILPKRPGSMTSPVSTSPARPTQLSQHACPSLPRRFPARTPPPHAHAPESILRRFPPLGSRSPRPCGQSGAQALDSQRLGPAGKHRRSYGAAPSPLQPRDALPPAVLQRLRQVQALNPFQDVAMQGWRVGWRLISK